MNLSVPVVSTDPGPDYALNVNNCFAAIDAHDHSNGKGAPVTPAGLSITSDLSMIGNNLTLARSTRFLAQSSTLNGASDLGCLYVNGVDLYFNDGQGHPIRITQSQTVAGSSGTITGLPSGTASASYSSGSGTFVFQSATSTPANVDGGSFIFRDITASSNGITVSAPNALSANYNLSLPTGLPAAKGPLLLDTAGNISTTTYDGIGLNMTSVGANAVATARTRATGASTEGVGGVPSASLSGNFNSSVTTWATIPGLTVTLTTSGRPIKLLITANSSGNAADVYIIPVSSTAAVYAGNIQVVNSTASWVVGFQTFGSAGVSSTVSPITLTYPAQFEFIDFRPAGTYTYAVEISGYARNLSNNPVAFTVGCDNLSLIAYEI